MGRVPATTDRPHPATAGSRRRADLDERLRSALLSLGPLPVLEGTVRRVIAVADRPETTTAELLAVLERDEALSANILGAARAARTARRSRPADLQQAITLLGRRGVRRLAVEAGTYAFLERAPGGGLGSRAELHAHAVAVATCAAALAERAGVDPEAAHLAGLLHDLGKLVLPMVFETEALREIVDTASCGRERWLLERERLGIDHAAAGAALAACWDLDPEVVLAIKLHHGAEDGGPVGDCVRAANALVRMLAGHAADSAALMAAAAALGLERGALDEVAEMMAGEGAGEPAAATERMRELERMALHDDLTGLATRGHWMSETRRALEGGPRGAVLLCDVDDFKSVNDEAGHPVGDAVLAAVADVLCEDGFAGRMGGDEFALWLELPAEEATAVAERLCERVAEATAAVAGGRSVGISVGVALVPEQGRRIEALLEVADTALYASKRGGKGTVSCAATGSGDAAPAHREAPAAPAGPPAVPGGAGPVLRAVLGANVRELAVSARARDAAEGGRAAAALDRALTALCEDDDAIALILAHGLNPRFLVHGLETAALACVTACRLGWSDDDTEQLAVAALFADVGMTCLDGSISGKPGRLTSGERAQLERHPELGAKVLGAIGARWPIAAQVALEHHERWDGSGYPAGLGGPAIRREARVVAVCHRYLAAVTQRPHRPAMPPHEALDLLYTLGGRLADPLVVRAFTESVAAYPLGALVRLSDGLCGRVVEGGMPTRPRVEVLWEADGRPAEDPRIIALSDSQTLFVTSLSVRGAGRHPAVAPRAEARGRGRCR